MFYSLYVGKSLRNLYRRRARPAILDLTRQSTVRSLEVRELACQRGGHVIISGLTFSVASHAALLLKGPNGSGKTTLLRTLAGFLAPASGGISIVTEGGVLAGDGERVSRLHYIGHANGIKPRLSVLENVRFWQAYYAGLTEMEDAEAALDAFGLLHLAEYQAAHLSQGQARRLGLARLLAAKRPIWLLDEPAVSLDSNSIGMLERTIKSHLSEGGLAIISAHGDLNLPGTPVLTLDSSRSG